MINTSSLNRAVRSRFFLRLAQFFVFFKEIKIRQEFTLLQQIHKVSGKGYLWIIWDSCRLFFKSFVTLTDYYRFELERQDKAFRDSFLGTLNYRMYKGILNPPIARIIAENKLITHSLLETVGVPMAPMILSYHPLGQKHEGERTVSDSETAFRILQKHNLKKCIVKPTLGQFGSGVKFFDHIEYLENDCQLHTPDGQNVLLSELLDGVPLIFEQYIQQTAQFSSFNPSSVNCLRFMTLLKPNGSVQLIATMLKIGYAGSVVDNASQGGNLNGVVDMDSGLIKEVIQFDGYRKTKKVDFHPHSNARIQGVYIENWKAIKEKVFTFHQRIPYLRLIGWDIAVTNQGPVVVELNSGPASTPQLFLDRGWKNEIKNSFEEWIAFEKKR